MVKAVKFKDTTNLEPEIQRIESERVILERAAYDEAGAIYDETDLENRKESEFLYYKQQFPETYYMWIDQLWRLLDERDGKEYIMYHAYHYVTQTVNDPSGKKGEISHEYDNYYGFWHRPIAKVKEFNPDGSFKKVVLQRIEKVYTIPWSKDKLAELLDSKDNRGTVNVFSLGLAPVDASMTVPYSTSTQQIRNREDFENHSFDEVMQLGRSQLSSSVPSMEAIQRTLMLRKQMDEKAKSQVKPAATTTTSTNSK